MTTLNDRTRKFLLILPLLAIPFTTLFFWALGGGANAQSASSLSKGLNMKVPGAHLKNDSTENKISFYAEAEKDSLKFKQQRKDDPYYKADTTKQDTARKATIMGSADSFTAKGYNATGTDNHPTRSLAANEREINQKLALLNRQVNQPSVVTPSAATLDDTPVSPIAVNSDKIEDPEMKQLGGMLDKIRDIQNPGLARQKQQEESEKNRGQVFAVTTGRPADPVSTLDNSALQVSGAPIQNGFYSLETSSPITDSQNTVTAVIHESQTIVTGATVKLRLTNDIFINGVLIPKDNLVFGIASLDGERLQVKISSIRYGNTLFPVTLSVYDLDGLNGIYIPGAIARNVAKESTDQSIQNLGFTTYDPSFGAQAASAGVSAAKTLFSRKVRLVKVQLKAGYQVLLRDEKQKQFNQ
jgi:conjugative transposon TraM protein